MTTLRANDARNRALRTFLQGLATDVLAAVILLVLPVFSNATGWQDVDWKVLGFLLAKTVAVTGLSFVMRQYLDASKLPTPLPPSDPGEPDDEVLDERGETWVGLALLVVIIILLLAALGAFR